MIVGQAYSGCVLEHGALEIAYRPLGAEHTTRYRLRYGDAPLQLDFALDDESGQLTSPAAYPPCSPDAACWP